MSQALRHQASKLVREYHQTLLRIHELQAQIEEIDERRRLLHKRFEDMRQRYKAKGEP